MASIQESECYSNRDIQPYVSHPVKPRVQEICEFAEKMGYQKVRHRFLRRALSGGKGAYENLRSTGLRGRLCCLQGRRHSQKKTIGIKEEEKIRIGQFEVHVQPHCSGNYPYREKTDFNILVGLCVGHDSLFFKYSEAFTTVLIAKDRVLGHNPAAALYTYRQLLCPDAP